MGLLILNTEIAQDSEKVIRNRIGLFSSVFSASSVLKKPYALPRTRLIAVESLAQLCSSVASCFRPDAVSV